MVEVSAGFEALLAIDYSAFEVFSDSLQISWGLYVSELPSPMEVMNLESRRALDEDQSESR